MSSEFRTDNRWGWRAESIGSHVTPNSVDEIEADMRHMSQIKNRNTEHNRTDYLTEKFSDLRVGEKNEFKQSEGFGGQGFSTQPPWCTSSQSWCQMPGSRFEGCYDSSQADGKFSSFPGELNHQDTTFLETGVPLRSDAMCDVMSDSVTSWNPAVLRRISSPPMSRGKLQDDSFSENVKFTASDSDSVSRVSFLLDENHVTHHVGYRNRKSQSMTNFLDLNSDVISFSGEGELNKSCNNCSDVSPDYQTADALGSLCGLSLSESDLDVISTSLSTSLTYAADVSGNVASEDVITPYLDQTQSPQSPDSLLDTPSEIKALTHNSLGRHDGDVIRDYQRSKSLDALRKRKRGRVASFRQSAISMANHVIGVFKRVKDSEGESRSTGKHGSPKKMKESRTEELGQCKQLFKNYKNTSIISSSSSSEYEIN